MTHFKVFYNPTKLVNTHLTNKYGIHFNFFLTKPTNEIVYNQTYATSTISFKDSVIYADNNQYLKRYYFLKNALDKDQIYDRINLLAEFYSTTVILKYEYPQMILTNTKSIFLKRLKRMKKILVQQGSSDQSKSNNSSKQISFNNCSSFLKSISFSELQQKSMDDSNHIQLDFSLFKESQYQIHDVYAENEENEKIKETNFFLNINKLVQEINVQLILQKQQNEDELKHLISDFDDLDKQDIIKKYHKIIEKENFNQSNKPSSIRKTSTIMKSSHAKSPLLIKDIIDKKPMTSSITITALQDHNILVHDGMNSPNTRSLQKTSMMSPLRTGISNQKITSEKQMMKRSSFYQYELENKKFLSNNEVIIDEDEFEESPNRRIERKLKKFPSMDLQGLNFIKTSRQDDLHSKGKSKPIESLNKQFKFQRKAQEYRNHPQHPHQYMKYSTVIGNQQPFLRKQKLYNREKRQQVYKSAINDVEEQDFDYEKFQNYKTSRYDNLHQKQFSNLNSPTNRMTSINININNLEEKKQRVNVNVNKNKIPIDEQCLEEQRNFRAEKKKKIREKAAALLNRVKSHEYLRSGGISNQFSEYESGDQYGNNYFERYYR